MDFEHGDEDGLFMPAAAIDGLLMAAQYDVEWREDLFRGFHFYDTSQSLEFQKHGYQVGVACQKTLGAFIFAATHLTPRHMKRTDKHLSNTIWQSPLADREGFFGLTFIQFPLNDLFKGFLSRRARDSLIADDKRRHCRNAGFLISMAERFPLYVSVRSCLKRLFEGSAVKSCFFRKLCQHANVTDILFFLKERLKNACMVFASFPMFLCEMKAFKCQIRVRMR